MSNEYVCVIGAANVDITGFAQNELLQRDSNIGRLSLSIGGVGRNIAENLVRLGLPTKLICPIGDDIYGKQIIENCKEIGIDLSDSLFMENTDSSVFLAIMDNTNDLALAIAAMSICEKITTEFIDTKREQIKNAKAVVLETNIPPKVLQHIVKTIPDQIYILDTVAGDKAHGCLEILHGLHSLKTNKIEAEILSNIKINSDEDLPKVAAFFHAKGVTNVFLTMGKQGSYYSNNDHQGVFVPALIDVVNTNGAGDAFVSGLVYAKMKGFDVEKAVKVASACADMAVSSEATVNPNINEASILAAIQ